MHRFFAGGLGTEAKANLEISVPAVLKVDCALKTRTEWHRRGRKVLVESRRVQMGKSESGTDMQRAASVGDQCRLLW